MSSTGISIILYPRSYNKRGPENLHSVKGVTSSGIEVNVKLRIDEKYLGKPYSPSIKEFARTERSAKSPCIATKDNSPEKREGMLLFSRAEVDPHNKTKIPTYIAKWAVILAADSSSPDPIIGIGRLDINRNGAQMEKIKASIESLEKAGKADNKNEIRTLKRKLEDPRNFSFPAIIYHPEKTITEDGTPEEFSDACKQAIEQIECDGSVVGLLLRARGCDGKILDEFTSEVFQKYRQDMQGYEPASLVVDRWNDTLREDLIDGIRYEAVPLSKFNNGWRGNQYYGAPGNYEKILGTYFDDAGNPTVCQVAVRVSHYPDQNLTLVSRVFPLSSPIGSPVLLNKGGTVDRENSTQGGSYSPGIRLVGLQENCLQRDAALMSHKAHDEWTRREEPLRIKDSLVHPPRPYGVIPEPTSESEQGETSADQNQQAAGAKSNEEGPPVDIPLQFSEAHETNLSAGCETEATDDLNPTPTQEETSEATKNQAKAPCLEKEESSGENMEVTDTGETRVDKDEATSAEDEAADLDGSGSHGEDNAPKNKAAPVTGMAAFLARRRSGA